MDAGLTLNIFKSESSVRPCIIVLVIFMALEAVRRHG